MKKDAICMKTFDKSYLKRQKFTILLVKKTISFWDVFELVLRLVSTKHLLETSRFASRLNETHFFNWKPRKHSVFCTFLNACCRPPTGPLTRPPRPRPTTRHPPARLLPAPHHPTRGEDHYIYKLPINRTSGRYVIICCIPRSSPGIQMNMILKAVVSLAYL